MQRKTIEVLIWLGLNTIHRYTQIEEIEECSDCNGFTLYNIPTIGIGCSYCNGCIVLGNKGKL